MLLVGYGARVWSRDGHMGTDEDKVAGADDRRCILPSETAAASV